MHSLVKGPGSLGDSFRAIAVCTAWSPLLSLSIAVATLLEASLSPQIDYIDVWNMVKGSNTSRWLTLPYIRAVLPWQPCPMTSACQLSLTGYIFSLQVVSHLP